MRHQICSSSSATPVGELHVAMAPLSPLGQEAAGDEPPVEVLACGGASNSRVPRERARGPGAAVEERKAEGSAGVIGEQAHEARERGAVPVRCNATNGYLNVKWSRCLRGPRRPRMVPKSAWRQVACTKRADWPATAGLRLTACRVVAMDHVAKRVQSDMLDEGGGERELARADRDCTANLVMRQPEHRSVECMDQQADPAVRQ